MSSSARLPMALPPLSPATLAFLVQVEALFSHLMRGARPVLPSERLLDPHINPDPGPHLGGKLLYVRDLDKPGRALIMAANIAGAATLAASADRAEQKLAIRDGIVDFLVNSLDEALRIFKNQVRKRETVAVCVAAEPAALEQEMRERGVAPDLMRAQVPFPAENPALLFDERPGEETSLEAVPVLIVWRAGSEHPRDLALLDEVALACLDADDSAAHRWLRLAPRYLGRSAQGLRLLSTHRAFAARFSEQLRSRVDRGAIAFPYEIRSYVRGTED